MTYCSPVWYKDPWLEKSVPQPSEPGLEPAASAGSSSKPSPEPLSSPAPLPEPSPSSPPYVDNEVLDSLDEVRRNLTGDAPHKWKTPRYKACHFDLDHPELSEPLPLPEEDPPELPAAAKCMPAAKPTDGQMEIETGYSGCFVLAAKRAWSCTGRWRGT